MNRQKAELLKQKLGRKTDHRHIDLHVFYLSDNPRPKNSKADAKSFKNIDQEVHGLSSPDLFSEPISR